MAYIIALALILCALVLPGAEILRLRKRVQRLERRLDALAQRTGNEPLASCWVSKEMRARLRVLKQEGKTAEAVRLLRRQTELPLVDAKEMIDNL